MDKKTLPMLMRFYTYPLLLMLRAMSEVFSIGMSIRAMMIRHPMVPPPLQEVQT